MILKHGIDLGDEDMNFIDLLILWCVIYISFIAGIECGNTENQKIVDELQIKLNESIEKQNQIKNSYEKQMLEIAINDTAAKEYALKYSKAHIFITFESESEVHYFLPYGHFDNVLNSDRINVSKNEIFIR